MAAKKKAASKSTDPKYGEIQRELDEILSGIDEGEVDIDDLSAKVERASELIRLSREKLESTRIRVQKVVESLEEDEEEEEEEKEEEAGGEPF